jgi:beta-RFAP synthase
MIRVKAPSRLHFGLLSLSPESTAGRRFGSVGLMVQTPGVRVAAEPAAAWSAHGPLAERALACARRFVQTFPPATLPDHRLAVETCAPEHVGLGTGTQLSLAVARALALSCGLDLDTIELATRMGRGQRSALGIHGFARGGFLVEAGKRSGEAISPLVVHVPLPEHWAVVLVLPPWGQGLHGVTESQAIAALASTPADLDQTGRRCRLVLLEMLPALAEEDWQAFGEAVYDFNRAVGEMFRPVQGGINADPRIAEVVDFVRRRGVPGVGQSSWGPGVFAIASDRAHGEDLGEQIRRQFGLGTEEVLITAACNSGATWA